jgi:NADPH:quinone reductase-like Zn-dependent oxidoreductase
MRAVVHDRYGPPEVLRVEGVERPAPTEDEVIVRVHATTVTQTDCDARREAGQSVTPEVDRTYPLTERAGAMSYLMARHPRGKVVVTP